MDDKKDKTDKEFGSGLTRREWLFGLAPAVVLSGFPGAPLGAAQEVQSAHSPLSPGLYAPSYDHLSHVLANESAFLRAPRGSQNEYLQQRSGPFAPQGFTPDEFPIVRKLTEIILGEDLKKSPTEPERGVDICDEVAEWIDLVVASAPKTRALARNLAAEHRALAIAYFGSEEPVREIETFEPERICREGLTWLEDESQRRSGKTFLDAGFIGQTELVQDISDARRDKSGVHAGTRLFDFLKAECIRGFYTSRVGLKELDHKGNSFYGEPPGCGLTENSESTADKTG